MRVKINLPFGTSQRTATAISRATRLLLEDQYPGAHISLGVQTWGPVGSVYRMDKTSDPDHVIESELADIDRIWRKRIASAKCPSCGRRVWKKCGSTPLETEMRKERIGGAPYTRYDARDRHNWGIVASQHNRDCGWMAEQGFLPYVPAESLEPPIVVVTVPASERQERVPIGELLANVGNCLNGGPRGDDFMEEIHRERESVERLDNLIIDSCQSATSNTA